MATWRKVLEHWTETKRVVGGKVVSVTCCCADPGGTANTCRLWSGNKSRCACYCHSVRHAEEKESKNSTREEAK